ncbi:MAG: sqd1 [Actinobacteria bacterium]|nr:sqd1 [Actinomycetota bacterium]
MAADGHLRWGAPTRLFGEVKPEAVVHFAEHRSAPFSMIDQEHAVRTQINNVVGRLNVMFAIKQAVPDCHRTAMDTQTPTGKPTPCRRRCRCLVRAEGPSPTPMATGAALPPRRADAGKVGQTSSGGDEGSRRRGA